MQALGSCLGDSLTRSAPEHRDSLLALTVGEDPQTNGPVIWLIDADPPVVIVHHKWFEGNGLEISLPELKYICLAWVDEELVDFDPNEHPQYESSCGSWFDSSWVPSEELEQELEEMTEEEAEATYEFTRSEEAWMGSISRLAGHYFAQDSNFGDDYHLGFHGARLPNFPGGDYDAELDDD
jgi:hypothetical protein